MTLEASLFQYFGYTEFRDPQKAIIEAALQNKDVFVLLPTGTGKSLCYQLPAVLEPGLTVVISPLKSLIQDQLDQLEKRNICSVGLNSETTAKQKKEIMAKILSDQVKLLYTTPETLETPELIGLLKETKVNRFVIDEAHCISMWGHDFRKSYRRLHDIRSLFPSIPIMACTATATKQVQKDLLYLLQMNEASFFSKPYIRHNLRLRLLPRTLDSLSELIQDIQTVYEGQSGIIYCMSRKSCEEMVVNLQREGIKCLVYHAGMTDKKRKEAQRSWKDNEVQVIVATIAFGMGIDKPNVRFVYHFNMPTSIENYYQEIGRAGRDGLPSDCTMYWHYQDKIVAEKMIRSSPYASLDFVDQQCAKLNALMRFVQNTSDCRHYQLCNYLGECFSSLQCSSCDNCIDDKSGPQTNYTEICQALLLSILQREPSQCSKKKIYQGVMRNDRFEHWKREYGEFVGVMSVLDRILMYLVANKFVKETFTLDEQTQFWNETYILYSKSKTLIQGKQEVCLRPSVIAVNPIKKRRRN